MAETSLGSIPEDLSISDVYTTATVSPLPDMLVGRRALYDELIWSAEGGFATAWVAKSSLVDVGDGYFRFKLQRQAFSAAGLALFVIGDATASGGSPSGPAGGDLGGTYPDPDVVRLQGIPVSTTDPISGQALVFNGSQWIPTTGVAPSGTASGDLSGTYPSPLVRKLDGRPIGTVVPVAGNVLRYDGSQWNAADVNPTQVGVSVVEYGAVGDGVADDTSAFQMALASGFNVFVPAGTYLLTAVLDLNNNQSIFGEGPASILRPQSGYAVRVQDKQYSAVRDLRIECAPGVGGVQFHATASGLVLYPSCERVAVLLASSGGGFGFESLTTQTAGGLIVYFPRWVDCNVESTAGLNDTSVGLKVSGPSGFNSRCVGGRWERGRISGVGFGFDLNNCDTFVVEQPALDGIYHGASPSTSGAGRAVKLGSNTQVCYVLQPRVEDNDVDFENLGTANTYESMSGGGLGTILDTGGSNRRLAGETSLWSVDRLQVDHQRPHSFSNQVGLAYHENFSWVSGTIYQLFGGTSSVSPLARIVGPVVPFSLGSIYIQPPTDPAHNLSGSIKYVYNNTTQPMTIVHQDGAALATERIITPTGANMVLAAGCIAQFIYDVSLTGGVGARRWIYVPSSDPSAVVGPASAVDERLARFDGTTGKQIQSSPVALTDAGAMSGLTGVDVTGNITLTGTVDGVDVGNLATVPFVTIGNTTALAGERALTQSYGINIADQGAGSTVDVRALTPVFSFTSTAHTLALAHSEALIQCSNVADQSITVPDNATVPFVVGTKIRLIQTGFGNTIVVDGAGVSVSPTEGFSQTLSGVGAVATLIKTNTNSWRLSGDLSPLVTVVASTSMTLDTPEEGGIFSFTSASPVTVTLPAHATKPFAIGSSSTFIRSGAGTLTVVGAGGVTVTPPTGSTATARVQGSQIVVTKTATDVWTVSGDLGGSTDAPATAQYVTLATDGTLTNERVLTAGAGISITDGGAGGAVTVASSLGTAYASSMGVNQALASSATFSVLNTNADHLDPGSSLTAGVFTAPSTGAYFVSADMAIDGPTGAGGLLYIERTGGVNFASTFSASSTGNYIAHASFLLSMTSAQTVTFYARQDSGSSRNITGRVSVFRVF